MLNLILFGPPGAGKGTQSDLLMTRYNLTYISTGEALRNEINEGTSLGLKARHIIESGGLVDDEIIVQIIEKTIQSHKHGDGFLFDGFPRTYVQAFILDGLFTRLQTVLSRIFILDVSDEVCTKRLLQRAKEQNRADDNEKVIKRRLQEYHQKTFPLLEFYTDSGIATTIDGNGTAEYVFEQIDKHIVEELRKRPANIIMFGYPGSGRATQAARLAKAFNLQVISTGNLLHEEVKAGGALAERIEPFLKAGLLVPDEIVVRLIEKKLKQNDGQSRGYVFKGYPRTLVQAYILDGILKKQGTAITTVINLQVPVLELIKRLDARAKTAERMPYDSETTTIVARLEEHQKRTEPVLDFYHNHNQVISIDGSGSVETVYEKIYDPVMKAIRNLK